jgi:hypothetical protein
MKGLLQMGKSKKDLTKNMKMTINMNELELNQRKFSTSEIGRGTGIHKNKKGKGSYTRKDIKYTDDSCGYIFQSKL